MAVDFNQISEDFLRVAREEVGSRLSTTKKEGADVPSVFLSRDTFIKPEYPYVTFDIITVDDSGSWLIQEGLDENDNPCFSSYYKVLIQYSVYGTDSLSIAQELKGKFRIRRILDQIKVNTNGTVEDVFAVSSLPERLSTRFVEVAAFNLTYNIIDTVVDEQTGFIETVNNTGTVTQDPQIDPENSLDLDITVTCPTN